MLRNAPLQHGPFPPHRFLARLTRNLGFAAALVGLSLLIGTVGYHLTARLPWVDAFLNAAMILTGMGPVDALPTAGAKLFAAFYALFSGTIFLTTAALVLVPVAHRVLHRFHLELDERNSAGNEPPGRGRPGDGDR